MSVSNISWKKNKSKKIEKKWTICTFKSLMECLELYVITGMKIISCTSFAIKFPLKGMCIFMEGEERTNQCESSVFLAWSLISILDDKKVNRPNIFWSCFKWPKFDLLDIIQNKSKNTLSRVNRFIDNDHNNGFWL